MNKPPGWTRPVMWRMNSNQVVRSAVAESAQYGLITVG